MFKTIRDLVTRLHDEPPQKFSLRKWYKLKPRMVASEERSAETFFGFLIPYYRDFTPLCKSPSLWLRVWGHGSLSFQAFSSIMSTAIKRVHLRPLTRRHRTYNPNSKAILNLLL
jgi:hypothetical protein